MSWFSSEDRTTFFACLCISCMIWLLSALSENYKTEVKVDIEFTNFPEDKILVEPPDSILYLFVDASGSDLMRSIGFYRPKIKLDYQKLLNTNSLSTASFINQFEEQLSGLNIIDIKPDSIYLDLEQRLIKKVPIVLMEKIETAKRFEIAGQVTIEPDSVLIEGPESLVDTIRFMLTETLELKNVTQAGNGELKLQNNFPKNVQIAHKTVQYGFTVEEFTEKRLTIPITTENLKVNKPVVLYPRSVELQCLVPTSEYNEIDKTYFVVIADFTNVDLSVHKKVPLEVVEQPINAKFVRILTKQADFIVFDI
ncbi:MAG: YbbR-like domain-containing protein [Chitinophagales bacterium]